MIYFLNVQVNPNNRDIILKCAEYLSIYIYIYACIDITVLIDRFQIWAVNIFYSVPFEVLSSLHQCIKMIQYHSLLAY